jgi:multicomponent Na+:H+ antiporter subunit E
MKMRTRLRFRLQWKAILLLTLVWLALWRDLTLLGILTGLLVSWLITVIFPLPPVRFHGRLHLWGFPKLVLLQLWDLFSASISLAVTAFHPSPVITPAVLKIQLRSNSDIYQTQTAEMIAIVPGTIVVESDRFRRILYIHAFSVADEAEAEKVQQQMLGVERRVMEAFASNAELAKYRAKVARSEARDQQTAQEHSAPEHPGDDRPGQGENDGEATS